MPLVSKQDFVCLDAPIFSDSLGTAFSILLMVFLRATIASSRRQRPANRCQDCSAEIDHRSQAPPFMRKLANHRFLIKGDRKCES